MLMRTRGSMLLLCLVLCAACASDDGVAVIEAMTDEGPALYTDTLTALEGEMAQVAMERAWSAALRGPQPQCQDRRAKLDGRCRAQEPRAVADGR